MMVEETFSLGYEEDGMNYFMYFVGKEAYRLIKDESCDWVWFKG